MLTFGSLFSGIGGFDLGLERAGWQCKWQVEIDSYCRRVLNNHWPNVPKYSDICQLTGEELEDVDLIAGGFPCQPVSVAGRRRGQDDERWLWPDFMRIIRALRPRFVLVENVPGLLIRGMSDVLGDLAACGYDAEWDCIPAAAFGASHRRYRVFIVAYPSGIGCIPGNNGARIFGEAPKRIENKGTWVLKCFRGRSGRVWQAPESIFDGVAYGVPEELDRLRVIGNAVIPAVVEWIGRRISNVSGEVR